MLRWLPDYATVLITETTTNRLNATISAKHKQLSYILLAATSLIWGTSFILIKKASQVLSPLEVGNLRIGYAFVAFLPIFWQQRKKIPAGNWGWIFLSGIMGSFLPSMLFSWAGAHISSSLSGMLNGATPLFTILVAVFVYGQRFSAAKWLGLSVGFIGALLLALAKGSGGISLNFYVLPVLVATILYAVNVNLLKMKLGHIPPIALSAASIVTVGPLSLAILLGATDFTQKIFNDPGAIRAAGYVAILGLLGTALALMLFNKLIQIAGALRASSVTYIMPIISVFWGLADGETMGPLHIVGLLGILFGVFLVNHRE